MSLSLAELLPDKVSFLLGSTIIVGQERFPCGAPDLTEIFLFFVLSVGRV